MGHYWLLSDSLYTLRHLVSDGSEKSINKEFKMSVGSCQGCVGSETQSPESGSSPWSGRRAQRCSVVISGGEVEDGGDVGPARLDVVALHVDHVGHTPHQHVPHCRPLVVLHYLLERSQK